jgi:Flp pilus assembly pilin Flp
MPATPQTSVRAPARRGLAAAASRRGTSAVEYALILGLVACGLGVGIVQFGPAIDQTFATIERALAMVPGLGAPAVQNLAPPSPPGPGTSGGGSGPLGGGGGTSSF